MVIVSLAALLLGSVSVATAEDVPLEGAPVNEGGVSITITSPQSGTVTSNPTPRFEVLSEEEGNGKVTLAILAGDTTKGATVQELPMKQSSFGIWEVTAEHLADGTYTAQVSETGAATNSAPVTFTVDTTPPVVTLTTPANASSTTNGSPSVAGSGGFAPGDDPSVTVQLFAGPTVELEPPIEALSLPVSSDGGWSGMFGGLGPGTYTVRAEQLDDADNLGVSAPVTFTVTPPPQPAAIPPPSASFTWFPTAPKTGEDVALLSSSTDSASPITGWAWALSKLGVFTAGKPLLTTSFSTPGLHSVQLQVTAADGLSSVATESVYVSSAPLVLMQPFPIVRIAGSETSSGVNLRLLTAQAPAGSHITVTCKGHGCPAKSVSKVATAGKRKGSIVTVEFSRFERSLPAGVVLEIRIFKAGEIGKFTRFTVRRNKLPERGDSCLGPTGSEPIVCPSS